MMFRRLFARRHAAKMAEVRNSREFLALLHHEASVRGDTRKMHETEVQLRAATHEQLRIETTMRQAGLL